MKMRYEEVGGGVRIPVRVSVRASRTEVAGEHDGALKVRVAAPPVDGEANAVLIAFLAKRLGVPKSAVRLVSGGSGRNKVVEVRGVDVGSVGRLLAGEATG